MFYQNLIKIASNLDHGLIRGDPSDATENFIFKKMLFSLPKFDVFLKYTQVEL